MPNSVGQLYQFGGITNVLLILASYFNQASEEDSAPYLVDEKGVILL